MLFVFTWTAFAVVVILASARLTRLVTFDHFPPVKWVREKYIEATDGSDWQLLGFCPYCASFWVTLAVLGSGVAVGATDLPDLGVLAQAWWILMGSLGASYLAAMVMVHDGDDEDDN